MERLKTLIATEDSLEEPGGAEIINGAVVCVKPGVKLTPEERQVIAEYIDFCRERAKKRREGLH